MPVINKIDLPSARPEDAAMEIEHLLGTPAEDCIFASAKTGAGIEEMLAAIVEQLPPPQGDSDGPAEGPDLRQHTTTTAA